MPYTVVGSVKFYDRKEIKDALAYLRAVVNPADEVALKRIINEPQTGDRGHDHRPCRPVQPRPEGSGSGKRCAGRGRSPQLNARAQTAIAEFVAIMDHLQVIEDEGGKAGGRVGAHDTGMLAALEAEKTIEAMGRVENLRELVGGRLRVRDLQRGCRDRRRGVRRTRQPAASRIVPGVHRARRRHRRMGRRRRGRDADDASHGQRPRVSGRVHRRDGGRGVPPYEIPR